MPARALAPCSRPRKAPVAGVHGDHHALWINPEEFRPTLRWHRWRRVQSLDRATHWRFLTILPVAQFYHVSFDMADPYNVYGGLQDNGTWMGPSRAVDGIANRHWRNIDFGDGFWAFSDPDRSGLSLTSNIRVARSRASANPPARRKDIKPLPRANEPEFRFNWNAPIHLSPNASRARSIWARSFCSAPATTANPGSASRPT